MFTINGKKFVVAESIADGTAGTDMQPTSGLGPDVTVLISDGDNFGLDAGDANQSKNIKKIAEVTGLKVVAQAVNGDGIRLTAGGVNGGLTLQIGDTADSFDQMKVSIGDMHTKSLGIDIGNQSGAAAAIQTIKNAINQVSSVRGDLGAIQDRLEHTGNNLSVMAENIQDAESTIRDTDVANEMMSYVKNNILVQSARLCWRRRTRCRRAYCNYWGN